MYTMAQAQALQQAGNTAAAQQVRNAVLGMPFDASLIPAAPTAPTTTPAGGNAAGGFGLGNLGYTPTALLDSLFPYLSQGQNTALTLALNQGQNQTSMYNTQVDAASRAQTAAAQAQAQLAAAQIAAQGGYAQQQLQSGTNAAIAQGQIQADIIRAAGGDANAAARLDATNKLQASLANQQQYGHLVDAATSTGLRDQLMARNFVRGGSQPEFGSALGIIGQPNWVTAPTTNVVQYGAAPTISAPSGQMPAFTTPKIDFGGGGISRGAGSSDLGSLFSSYNSQVGNILGGFGINYGETPTTPVGSVQGGSQFGGSRGLPARANGGPLPEQGALVGENGPEAIIKAGGKYHVVPLTAMATGGSFGGSSGLPTSYRGATASTTAAPSAPRTAYAGATADSALHSYLNRPKTPLSQQVSTQPVGPPPAISGSPPAGSTASSPAGGTSPTVKISPDGSINIGASQNPTQTGQEILGLPAMQAYANGDPSGYRANQSFALPEYGLSNLPGPAMLARYLGAGSPLNPQEKQDWMTLLQAGGYAPEVIQEIVQRSTPGARPYQQAIGY